MPASAESERFFCLEPLGIAGSFSVEGSFSHTERGAQTVLFLERGGGGLIGGAKCFRPAIFPFAAPSPLSRN